MLGCVEMEMAETESETEIEMQTNSTAAVITFFRGGGVKVDKQAFCKECWQGFGKVCM